MLTSAVSDMQQIMTQIRRDPTNHSHSSFIMELCWRSGHKGRELEKQNKDKSETHSICAYQMDIVSRYANHCLPVPRLTLTLCYWGTNREDHTFQTPCSWLPGRLFKWKGLLDHTESTEGDGALYLLALTSVVICTVTVGWGAMEGGNDINKERRGRVMLRTEQCGF